MTQLLHMLQLYNMCKNQHVKALCTTLLCHNSYGTKSYAYRSLLVSSHFGPAATHAIWALCWNLGLHARTPSHPPLVMLQDLFVPCHQAIAKAGDVALVSDTIRLSIVLVGLGDHVLCLGLWPSSTQRAQGLAGA